MASRINTDLSHAQHARLEALGDREPEATVVGWYHNGPVIRRFNGRLSRLLPSGRMTGLGAIQAKSMEES
jgi:hypothetical protein